MEDAAYIANFREITDGLEDLPASENGKPIKFFRDGQFYILRDGILYDARGAKVE